MDVKDLRDKTVAELRKIVDERQARLRDLRFEIANRQLRNHREYRHIRREIAVIMTIAQERLL